MFFIIIFTQIILPVLFVIWFHVSEFKGRANFILQFLCTATFIGYTWVVGAQSWSSILIGFVIVLAFVLSASTKIRRLPKKWGLRIESGWKDITFVITQSLILILFLPIVLFGLMGYSIDGSSDKSAIDLNFPLDQGVYIVGHGGSNPLINYHNVHDIQTYALDISKLNFLGIRALGIYPSELEKYAIFGDNLYSPCDGRILKVDKGYEDLEPPKRGEGHPAGNHVVVQCEDAEITLAHMKENSIVVDTLDTVEVGDLLGKVGNSGNTTEPHLHIHAVKDGKGIPVTFNNRFLVRNSIVWK